MPVNRRIKSFSPYSYSIQYKRAGDGPLQKPHPYVNAAIMNEDQYVVAKKDPNWRVYVSNTVIYTLDEDCNVSLDKARANIRIVSVNEKLEDFDSKSLVEIKEGIKESEVIDISKSNGGNFAWISSNLLEINHFFNCNVDCVILADGEYVKISKEIASPNKIIVYFDDNFDRSRFSNITAIVYMIGFQAYPAIKIDREDIVIDNINDAIWFENSFMTNSCVPLIFDSKGKSYSFENIDLTPNRVIVDASSIKMLNRAEMTTEINDIEAQIDQILNENSDVPSSVIFDENNEFRNLIERRNTLTEDIELLNGEEEYADIKEAILYSFDSDSYSNSLKLGVNDETVKWAGSTVTIAHNLNAYVNVIIDDTLKSNTSYKIYDIDKNHIKIEFGRPDYVVCNVRVFKIGDR